MWIIKKCIKDRYSKTRKPIKKDKVYVWKREQNNAVKIPWISPVEEFGTCLHLLLKL